MTSTMIKYLSSVKETYLEINVMSEKILFSHLEIQFILSVKIIIILHQKICLTVPYLFQKLCR